MTNSKEIIETGWNLDNSYARLSNSFYKSVKPKFSNSPNLIILNYPLARSLGLNVQWLLSSGGIEELSGNKIPNGSLPIAQAYAGHQFGHFTMLGDGRAILIGEQITPKSNRVDIQLKGSGETPYSRSGDGLAALGPMLREYIISEAMHGLGIETTRSLTVVTTGEKILRETILPGAILTRVAQSHIRVGTFQYVANWGTADELRELADYTIQRHFPIIDEVENRYIYLLNEVIKRQAKLISKWQLVGFIHGVMNTDNMTINGETIDYGPCAFMDTYDLETVFSSIDTYGRYAYGNQPKIAEWNLMRFAETLLPLLNENMDQAIKIAQDSISEFNDLYHKNWLSGMVAKLGIFNIEKEDEFLVDELLSIMQKYHADYTNTFRALTFDKMEETVLYGTTEFSNWYEKWKKRLSKQKESSESSKKLMRNSNPSIIPRNHRVEESLEAAVKYNDYGLMEKLLDVLSNPYAHTKEQAEYTTLPDLSNKAYKTFCGT